MNNVAYLLIVVMFFVVTVGVAIFLTHELTLMNVKRSNGDVVTYRPMFSKDCVAKK